MAEEAELMRGSYETNVAKALDDAFLAVAKAHETGLCIVDIATGAGKTYAAVTFSVLADNDDSLSIPKIIYLGGEHKYLPKKEDFVQAYLACHGGTEKEAQNWVEANVLHVGPVAKSIAKALTEDGAEVLIEQIPPKLREDESFRALLSAAKKYAATSELQRDFKDLAERELERAERAFRKVLKNYLSSRAYDFLKKRGHKKPRPQAIANQKKHYLTGMNYQNEFGFVRKLYPACKLEEQKILVMTMKKALCSIDLIYRDIPKFALDECIMGSVVFIDEFDAMKAVMKNHICERAVESAIDLGYLPTLLIKTQDIEMPRVLLGPVKDRFDDRQRKLAAFLEDMKQKIGIHHNYYWDGDDPDEDGKGILFYDGEVSVTTIGSRRVQDGKATQRGFSEAGQSRYNRGYVSLAKEGSSDEVNSIYFESEKRCDEDLPLSRVINLLNGCMVYIFKALATQASMLMESTGGKSVSEFIGNVSTMLFHYKVDRDPEREFATHQVFSAFSRKKANTTKDNDGSFYKTGFRLTNLKNSPNHRTFTKINQIQVDETAEELLAEFAKNNLVFGLSATATVETVLGNYDLEWMKGQLGSGYIELKNEQREAIERAWERQNEFWEATERHFVSVESYEEDSDALDKAWEELYEGDPECVRDVRSRMEEFVTKSDSCYVAARYQRMVTAFKGFLESGAQSMVAFCMKSASDDKTFSRDTLKQLFLMVLENELEKQGADITGAEQELENMVFYATSEGFEKEIQIMNNRLLEGGRVFLLTAYGTMSRGVNLKEPIGMKKLEDIDVVQVRYAYPGKRYKDWDAVYLDRPTNLLPYGADASRLGADLTRQAYDLATLYEVGSLTRGEYSFFIKKLIQGAPFSFQKFDAGVEERQKKTVQYINQALGRVGRTALRRRHTWFFYDAEIIRMIDPRALNLKTCSIEYREFINHIRENIPSIPENDWRYAERVRDRACAVANRHARIRGGRVDEINDRRFLTLEKMETWESFREESMRNPTKNGSGRAEKDCWIDQVTEGCDYSYDVRGDFNHIDVRIGWVDDILKPDTRPMREVSERAARLPELMRIEGLKKRFSEKGYATVWRPGNLILSPAVFIGDYLGALGEEAGYHVFELCGLALERIRDPQAFERFDYKVPKLDAYVDFKHHVPGFEPSVSDHLAEIVKDMRAIGAKRALVANILKPRSYATASEKSFTQWAFGDVRIGVIDWLFDAENDILRTDRIADAIAFLQEASKGDAECNE